MKYLVYIIYSIVFFLAFNDNVAAQKLGKAKVYSLAAYAPPEKNSYVNNLDGTVENPVFVDNRNYKSLIDLDASHNTLHLNPFARIGIWEEIKNIISLEIMPILYQPEWYSTLFMLRITLLVVLYLYLKNIRLKKINKLRMQISSDLHDEVGGVLTAVGMQAEMLQNSNLDKNPEQLKKIANLSRAAVSAMRDVIWSIDIQNDRIVNLIDRMNEYLNLIFEDTPIIVDFKYEISKSNEFIDLDTKQNTYLIFKEAINNIVKHASAKNVQVRFLIIENKLHLKISSDGKCKLAAKEGMGLKNMQARANNMNAELHIDRLNNYELRLTKNL